MAQTETQASKGPDPNLLKLMEHYPLTAYNVPKTGKSRNKLAQRFDHTVFVEVNIRSLSPQVLAELAMEAILTKARAKVKKLNAETATEDEIKAAMQAAFEEVKSGKNVGEKKAKPKMDEETKAIRAEARSILRENFKRAIEESNLTDTITGKQITSKIAELFKQRDAFHRSPEKNAEFSANAKKVDAAMAIAAQRIKERTADVETLGPLVAEMQAQAANGEQPAPKPKAKPQAAKPKAKGQAQGQGRSA